MKGLDWNRAMEDIRTGVAYLQSRGVKKVGVVGFCMGGALVGLALKVPLIQRSL